MYMKNFLKQITDFIFYRPEPQKSRYYFYSGNGFKSIWSVPCKLYREGFAKKLLPSSHYNCSVGHLQGFKNRTVSGKF